jgi:hypothetical protein
MARRRRDRWLPDEAVSLPREARGELVADVVPPAPVRAWIRTYDGQDHRVDAAAIAASSDAVLIEWGSGQAATAAWVWRAAVKHRKEIPATP